MSGAWRIAAALNPGRRIVGTRDLSVLKGIQLDSFNGVGDWLSVDADMDEGGDLLTMAVETPGGTAHYKLCVELNENREENSRAYAPADLELGAWKWIPKQIYKDYLFHGEALQVVKQLLGVSDTGCRGVLQMPDDADDKTHRVAMLDGGLQLALLWERQRFRPRFIAYRIRQPAVVQDRQDWRPCYL